MPLSRRSSRPNSRSRGRWWFAIVALIAVAAAILALTRPVVEPAPETVTPPTSRPAPESPVSPVMGAPSETPMEAPAVVDPATDAAPRTADFRELASAAATAIYTWDTRTASYSEVYSRLRAWWHVLPDGSNPLAVLVQEFEATGINAGSYAALAGQQAHRAASVKSLMCDDELAKVREQPAPWIGLHVCTVRVNVVDQSAAGRNAYTAPVSVMVNCPPAATAPADRCVLVGFYATPNRIVY